MEISKDLIGAAGAVVVFIAAWLVLLERRLARLEGKIDLLFRVGCGFCRKDNQHGKQ